MLLFLSSDSCFGRSVTGMDYTDPKRKGNFVGKLILVAVLTALCIVMLKQSPAFNSPSPVSL